MRAVDVERLVAVSLVSAAPTAHGWFPTRARVRRTGGSAGLELGRYRDALTLPGEVAQRLHATEAIRSFGRTGAKRASRRWLPSERSHGSRGLREITTPLS